MFGTGRLAAGPSLQPCQVHLSWRVSNAEKIGQRIGGNMAYQGLEGLPFIGEKQIAAVLTWRPLIDALEDAMIAFSAGKVAQPVRQMVPVPGEDAIIAAMLAVGESMAVKVEFPSFLVNHQMDHHSNDA